MRREWPTYTVLPYSIAFDAAVPPEDLRPIDAPTQFRLALETNGVLRYVWESRFGPMLIEVVDGVTFVNGSRVEAAGIDNPLPEEKAP